MSRFAGPLLGLLAAGVLLAPSADEGELARQIVGRSLAQDANADGPLFRMLAAGAAGRGFALEAPAALRAPFQAALNVYNARSEGPLRIDPAAQARLELSLAGRAGLRARLGERRVELPGVLPARGALLAPLCAIVIALAFRQTVLALYAGVLVGSIWLRLETGQGWALAVAGGAWDVPALHLYRQLVDAFRIELIGFTFALIAMVGVMIRGGGVQGFVEWLLRFASTARSTLLVSFGMGLAIFFDDYSNCLIVGNTMRPLTDRLRVPREKLAYVVDSTAAPVAGLSMFSTWVVFEVSTYAAQLPAVGITESPYAVFLQTLPFRFYCVFSLAFVLLNLWTQRDFGPMRAAEARAAATGEVVRAEGTPLLSAHMTGLEAEPGLAPRASDALLPIATVIGVTVFEIFRTGGGFELLADDPARLRSVEGITGVLFAGGGAGPLLTASSCGWAVAAFLVGSRTLRGALVAAALVTALVGPAWVAASPLAARASLAVLFAGTALLAGALLSRVLPASARASLAWGEIARASLNSVRALLFAIVILFGAWMIGSVCEQARTAEYLVALTSGVVTPLWLPVLLFGAACLVSFSTGTSWGTMAILLPNVVALAAALGAEHPIGSFGMVTVCIGAVLEGSIFGDHCSPISDTTVLSSVATASDHLDHVRTQAPYALCVAVLAVLAGYLPTLAFGFWSFPLALASAVLASLALLYGLGRRSAPPA